MRVPYLLLFCGQSDYIDILSKEIFKICKFQYMIKWEYSWHCFKQNVSFFPSVQPPIGYLKTVTPKFFRKIQRFNFEFGSGHRNALVCLNLHVRRVSSWLFLQKFCFSRLLNKFLFFFNRLDNVCFERHTSLIWMQVILLFQLLSVFYISQL